VFKNVFLKYLLLKKYKKIFFYFLKFIIDIIISKQLKNKKIIF